MAVAAHAVVAVLAVVAATASPARATPSADIPLRLVSGSSPLTAERCDGAQPSEAESFPWLAVRPGVPQQRTTVWMQDGLAGVVAASSADGGANWQVSVPDGLVTCEPGAAEHATEPRVAITPGGAIYATSYIRDDLTTASGRTLVARSADGGKSWATVTRPDAGVDPLNDFDAIAAEPDVPDAVNVLWSQPEAAGEPTIISRTTDGGLTWKGHIVRVAQPGTSSWSQLVALPGGRLVVVYQDAPLAETASPAGLEGAISAVVSTNHGASWSPPVQLGAGTPLQWPSVAAGPDGTVYASWVRAAEGDCRRFASGGPTGIGCEAVVVRSDDGGKTWTAPSVVLGWSGAWMPTPAVAVAGNGSVGLLATVPEGTGGERASTWLAHSHDCGATWERSRVAGPFAVGSTPGESDGLGLAHQLVGLPDGVTATVVQGTPAAARGATDVFAVESRLASSRTAECPPPPVPAPQQPPSAPTQSPGTASQPPRKSRITPRKSRITYTARRLRDERLRISGRVTGEQVRRVVIKGNGRTLARVTVRAGRFKAVLRGVRRGVRIRVRAVPG